MTSRWLTWIISLGMSMTIACSGGDAEHARPVTPCVPDESAPVTPRDSYGEWTMVALPGTTCSNGSQYKYFVRYSQTTNNVLVLFEFGASCWDYDTCTTCGLSTFCASAQLKGYTNQTGIDDSHMGSYGLYYPEIRSLMGSDAPFADWNIVYLPYCTGDMQMGSKVATYTSADGTQTINYSHTGHTNMVQVAGWMNEQFKTVPRLVLSGPSSGGTAAMMNYDLLRNHVQGAQCGYLVNDSGPMFHSTGASGSFQAALRKSYNLQPLIASLGADLGPDAAAAVQNDLGAWPTVLARAYPRDRLTTLLFQRDLNYLFLSYDSITPGKPDAELAADWQADLTALRADHDKEPNLAYYMPYFRADICSDVLTLPPMQHLSGLLTGAESPWLGTEIAEDGSDASTFINDLLNDPVPLHSHFEVSHADGEYDDKGIMDCRTTGRANEMSIVQN